MWTWWRVRQPGCSLQASARRAASGALAPNVSLLFPTTTTPVLDQRPPRPATAARPREPRLEHAGQRALASLPENSRTHRAYAPLIPAPPDAALHHLPRLKSRPRALPLRRQALRQPFLSLRRSLPGLNGAKTPRATCQRDLFPTSHADLPASSRHAQPSKSSDAQFGVPGGIGALLPRASVAPSQARPALQMSPRLFSGKKSRGTAECCDHARSRGS
ncbi:hypothetical protein PsYK624_111830 [Phanerochaete sordida]|uniref:Uncharacterized protein n=1 Tax=Phanerochaete sordida TaxID=48140 RepID=A0A9P3LH60_9APHY|nr:hypothetical protein PsYK624_111830 [Phanerochaete sordida]